MPTAAAAAFLSVPSLRVQASPAVFNVVIAKHEVPRERHLRGTMWKRFFESLLYIPPADTVAALLPGLISGNSCTLKLISELQVHLLTAFRHGPERLGK